MKIANAVMLTAAAAGIGCWVWGLNTQQGRPTTDTLKTAENQTSAAVGCLGRIEPASRIRHLVQSESLGTVVLSALWVKEGQEVRKGDLLARFGDHARRQATVERMQAEVQLATQHWNQVRTGAKPNEIQAAEARVRREASRLAQAERDVDRFEKLHAAGSITLHELEARQTEKTLAQADLEAARKTAAALAEIRPVDVAVAEAELARARAALRFAEAEAALSELHAPIDGTVLRIHTQPGEAIRPEGVLDLADLSEMDVVVEVYETDAHRIERGQKAVVLLPDGQRLKGEVIEPGYMVRRQNLIDLDPVRDIDTRVVEARVRLNPKEAVQVRHLSHLRVQVLLNPPTDKSAPSTPVGH